MGLGLLVLRLRLPGCASLKEKRSRLRPLLARLHSRYNVSAAEVGEQDSWQESVIACALVSNDRRHTQSALQTVATWVENDWRDVEIIEEQIEIF